MLRLIVKSVKRDKHQVFLSNGIKQSLMKEFKTLKEAINFTKRIGGRWNINKEE